MYTFLKIIIIKKKTTHPKGYMFCYIYDLLPNPNTNNDIVNFLKLNILVSNITFFFLIILKKLKEILFIYFITKKKLFLIY
jgi:hypothetical protein